MFVTDCQFSFFALSDDIHMLLLAVEFVEDEMASVLDEFVASDEEIVDIADGSGGAVVVLLFVVFGSGSGDFGIGDLEGLDHIIDSGDFLFSGVDTGESALWVGHGEREERETSAGSYIDTLGMFFQWEKGVELDTIEDVFGVNTFWISDR